MSNLVTQPNFSSSYLMGSLQNFSFNMSAWDHHSVSSSGFIAHTEVKTPAFIFGERVVAPLVDKASKAICWAWAVVDQTFSSLISWPPGAEALEKNRAKVLGKNPILSQEWWETLGIDPATLAGDFLQGLFKDVESSLDRIISNAENSIIRAEIEACREVSVAIANIKEAYKESLDLTISEIDREISAKFEQLFGLVDKIVHESMEDVEKIMEDAQQLVNSLPFSDKHPQVTRISPRYIVPDNSSTPVPISFYGNFYYNSDKGFQPTFKINNQSLPLLGLQTQQLIFAAPSKYLPFPQDIHSYSYLVGNLIVPWKSGWIITSTEVSTFDILLGMLPSSPGHISLEYTSYVPARSTQPYATAEQKAWCDNYYPQGWKVMTFAFYPEEGWYFDTSSVNFQITYAHGSHSERITTLDKSQIVLEFGCTAKDGKHMGRINYIITAMQYKDGTQPQKNLQELNLVWGDRKVIGNPTLVTFEPFDGGPIQQFAGPSSDNKYIQILKEGDQLVIKAVLPKDI